MSCLYKIPRICPLPQDFINTTIAARDFLAQPAQALQQSQNNEKHIHTLACQEDGCELVQSNLSVEDDETPEHLILMVHGIGDHTARWPQICKSTIKMTNRRIILYFIVQAHINFPYLLVFLNNEK